jgi:hypothetical protein
MPSWLNRRRHHRNEVQIPVAYRRAGGGLCWTRSYDVSAGGVRIRSFEPLQTGTALELSLYLPGQHRDRVLVSRGVVVWCRENGDPDAALACGVMFQQMLPELLHEKHTPPATSTPGM